MTNKEAAEYLLSIIDGPSEVNANETGITEFSYIGQGIYKIYLDRDKLVRIIESSEGN